MIISTCRSLQCLSAYQKNFIIHFFLETLHFKKSCNLIGRQHFGPWIENQNFASLMTGDEISITILVFDLDYFQEKLMTKLFKKSPKKTILGPFWALFPTFGQKCIFQEKRALLVFKNSSYLPLCKKNKKIRKN